MYAYSSMKSLNQSAPSLGDNNIATQEKLELVKVYHCFFLWYFNVISTCLLLFVVIIWFFLPLTSYFIMKGLKDKFVLFNSLIWCSIKWNTFVCSQELKMYTINYLSVLSAMDIYITVSNRLYHYSIWCFVVSKKFPTLSSTQLSL